MPLPTGKLVQASFFWKNDQPGGLGFTFGPPGLSPEYLTYLFAGEVINEYIRDSDAALGTNVVQDYLDQLATIAARPKKSLADGLLAALNIIWLAERGFIPNNEFNGPQYVLAQE